MEPSRSTGGPGCGLEDAGRDFAAHPFTQGPAGHGRGGPVAEVEWRRPSGAPSLELVRGAGGGQVHARSREADPMAPPRSSEAGRPGSRPAHAPSRPGERVLLLDEEADRARRGRDLGHDPSRRWAARCSSRITLGSAGPGRSAAASTGTPGTRGPSGYGSTSGEQRVQVRAREPERGPAPRGAPPPASLARTCWRRRRPSARPRGRSRDPGHGVLRRRRSPSGRRPGVSRPRAAPPPGGIGMGSASSVRRPRAHGRAEGLAQEPAARMRSISERRAPDAIARAAPAPGPAPARAPRKERDLGLQPLEEIRLARQRRLSTRSSPPAMPCCSSAIRMALRSS